MLPPSRHVGNATAPLALCPITAETILGNRPALSPAGGGSLEPIGAMLATPQSGAAHAPAGYLALRLEKMHYGRNVGDGSALNGERRRHGAQRSPFGAGYRVAPSTRTDPPVPFRRATQCQLPKHAGPATGGGAFAGGGFLGFAGKAIFPRRRSTAHGAVFGRNAALSTEPTATSFQRRKCFSSGASRTKQKLLTIIRDTT
jgi:hypothetical protein